MRLWSLVARSMAAGSFAVACTSTLVDRATSETDVSADPELDPDSPDAVATDAENTPDAAPPKPLEVVCEDEDVCYVAVSGNGAQHLCGLLKDGTVRCWGRDTASAGDAGDGALGRGVPVSPIEGATPARVVGLSNVTQISVGPNLGTCARTSDGSVYCWGRNEFGQLGSPATESRLMQPTRVEGIPPVDEVQLGHAVGCAIGSSDRALYCWGRRTNDEGLPFMDGLGIDAGGSTFSPRRASNVPSPVRAVAVATDVDRTIDINGTAMQTVVALLDGDILATVEERPVATSDMPLPAPSLAEVPGVTQLWEFAYSRNGLVWQWRGSPSATPLYVPSLSRVVDVKLGLSHIGVLVATGHLFRWGTTAAGALGFTSETVPTSTYPLEMEQVEGQVISFAVSAGAATCASLVSGRIKCWGSNALGELGRGTVDTAPHPEAEFIE